MSISLGVTEIEIEGIENGLFLNQGEINQLNVLLKSGTAYTRGTLLGKITATGKYTTWDNSDVATDGSEVLSGVLLADVDATDADEYGYMAINGVLNVDKLTAVDPVVAGEYNYLGSIIIKGGIL